MKTSGVYVVTSDGRDQFADMALVSVLSLRMTNPGLRIVMMCDRETAGALKDAQHRVTDLCDEVIPVDVPPGPAVWRNRWMKSQVGLFVNGQVLYVDADIVVRKPLGGLASLVRDIGGAANRNQPLAEDQIWEGDRAYIKAMGWGSEFKPCYFNGGFLFFNGTEKLRPFFREWHENYLEGAAATGTLQDQPALNTALAQCGFEITELPATYNAQVIASTDASVWDARVWHFYSSQDVQENVFTRLVARVPRLKNAEIESELRRLFDRSSPWTLKSHVYNVETTTWDAYRRGLRLRLRDLIFLVRKRCNWKNLLLVACYGSGVSFATFESLLRSKSRLKMRRCKSGVQGQHLQG